MLAKVLMPHPDLASLVLRLTLALIFVTNGYAKMMLGDSWTQHLSLPMQAVVAWTEFLCGLALLAGLLTRLAAFGILVIMVGAIVLVTGGSDLTTVAFTPRGFDFRAVGHEYNLVISAMCLTLILLGGGVASLDRLLWLRYFQGKKSAAAGAGGNAARPAKQEGVPVSAGAAPPA